MKMANFWETTLFGDINKSLHITPQSNLGNLGFINALSVWDHSKRKDAQKKSGSWDIYSHFTLYDLMLGETLLLLVFSCHQASSQ